MKKVISLLLLIPIVLTGCMATAVSPVSGILVTDVKGPLTATDLPNYSKVGTASCFSILGLVGVGDASIDTAAKNAGITKIHHVDYKSFSILGILAQYTVYVYGD